MKKTGDGAAAQEVYTERRVAHWDAVAEKMDHWQGLGGYYPRRLAEGYLTAVPPGQRVLELGCAEGDLLAACKPGLGVGIDFSSEMIRRAQVKHPDLHFRSETMRAVTAVAVSKRALWVANPLHA